MTTAAEVEKPVEENSESNGQSENLTKRHEAMLRLNDQIIDQRHRVKECEQEHEARKAEAKEAKEKLETEQGILNRLIDDLDDIREGRPIQGELPYKDEEDIHGKAGLEVLQLGGKITELLIEAEIESIEQLEQRMAEGDIVPGAIKGIGEAGIDAITDALEKYRAEHPKPIPREAEETEATEGEENAAEDAEKG